MNIQDAGFSTLGLQKSFNGSPKLCCYTRGLEKVGAGTPILVLIHGYPQTSYIWRRVIPLLPESMPLFVPDLPGYGYSEPLMQHDKLTVGQHILSTLASLLSTDATHPIVLIGHDRGARIAHRLAVSFPSLTDLHLSLLSVCLLDIVPTTVQWRALGADPQAALQSWHWPFLAGLRAPEVMMAYGGSRMIEEFLDGWAGDAGVNTDDALEVYRAAFSNESVIRASCADYAAGATVDVAAQKEDQQAGTKVMVPLLVLHGAGTIDRVLDVTKEWKEWVGDPSLLTVHRATPGVKHFLPEEAPEETVDVLLKWMKAIQVLDRT